MLEILALAFALGLKRGASACMALCVPSIIPAIADRKDGWKGGLKVSLLFNLPRIAVLTCLGAGLGATGYALGSAFSASDSYRHIWVLGYLIVGCAMLAYGAYTFARATDRLADVEEGKECERKISHPVLARLRFVSPKSKSGLLLWGSLVSLACLGETVIAMEGAMVTFAGSGFGSWLTGAEFGALAFFLFGLGAALPSLALAGFGGELAQRGDRKTTMLKVERAAGVLMLAFGAILLFSIPIIL
jgi:sulfite exporter TauE/SafE